MNEDQTYYSSGSFAGYNQEPEPIGAGIGGTLGGEVNVDGTPMRVATIVILAVLGLVIFHQAKFMFHVVI